MTELGVPAVEQLVRWGGRGGLETGVLEWGLLDRSVMLQGALPPVGVMVMS